ncbi:ATP-binding protein [Streptomyces sp. t39]|uniref:ATP-binding protein n=1 Tax=Streptomyces sp. t39 TaxID=1828156 RepID=UPI0011CECB52|nr:ATP-binding protein [Streptomyces sp. t39]TXS44472.1 ATP-binding protein [Streptomyces sp. t39]
MNVPVSACQYSIEVPATPERVPQIRRIVAAHLRHWNLASQVAPVCGALDELVGNVVRHVEGDKTCVVELRWSGSRLSASVADRDRRLPPVRTSAPSRGGLAKVAKLSDSWGTCGTDDGKVVWFTRRVKESEHIGRGPRAPRVPAVEFRPLPAALAAGLSDDPARSLVPAR